MKKLLTLLTIILLAQSAWADDESAASLLLGYCNDKPFSGMVLGGARRESFVCVKFDEEFVKQYAGCEVSSISVCMAGIVGKTAGVWLTESLPAEVPYMSNPNDIKTDDFYKCATGNHDGYAYHFDYEGWMDVSKGQDLAWQWVEQALNKTYVIKEGVPFYAGFRVFQAPGSASNAVVALENGGTDPRCYVYFPESQDHWGPLAQTNMAEYGSNLMIKVRVSGGSLPENDITLAAVQGDEFLKTGEPYSYRCIVHNSAANVVKKFNVSYSLDGVLQTTKTLTAAEGFGYNQNAGFTLEGISFTTPGEHELSVTVSNPNGAEDLHPEDNTKTLKLTVYNAEDALPRNVLVETFTGVTCGNCPGAHEREAEAFEGLDVIMVTHHSGYTPDVFTTDADQSYTWFYNSNGTFAPAIMLDRTNVNSFYATGYYGPVFLPGEPTDLRSIYTTLSNTPTTVNVKLAATYDSATRQLSVTASGDVLSDPLAANPCLNVWLTESNLKAFLPNGKPMAQSGSPLGADYIHNNVFRVALTPTWGEAIDLSGNSYERTYTCTLDEKWVPENMEIVGFLANIDSKDCNNCRVLNAAKMPLPEATDGIEKPILPARRQAAPTTDLQGRRVGGAQAPRGVYIVGQKKILH